ncbi:uncharacterized protein At5g41620-like isoform X2 [Abrus precatorius]|uniref:Uncharacterized protein At5g41620-like isoform X2 n=1 Tax=Abrus precatorius TaxID=3816 RepID=A0A8B8L8K9_ABRPR|nr:uncharacterized protein At5g41620-like isoform X2 [Abrus precatorius]
MARREKSKKKEELMVEKWKLVGKRGCPSTPPPTWRLEFPSKQNGNNKNVVQEFLNFPTSTLSARKLCAKLWEIQPHQLAPLPTMSKPGIRLRSHFHHRRDNLLQLSKHMSQTPHSPPHQTASGRGLRRHVQTSLVHHRRSVKRNDRTLQPVSPASYSSSMQVKELRQEKQLDKLEMENLTKQITENKFVRKNKEHDKIEAAIQSVKEEIEDERRLRKHSESLHRRLARELSEVKYSFSSSLRDLGKERKTRILLENLCDDFAKGIRDCEHELRSLMHNAEKGQVKGDNIDRLILHLSEAWLEERKQMNQVQAGSDLLEIDSIVDKLGVDIETFLRAKRSVNLRRYGNSSSKKLKEIYPCSHSLDSFLQKEGISALHNMDEEDSISTHIFKQKRTSDKGFDKPSCKLSSNNTVEVHKEKKSSLNSEGRQAQSKEITEDSELEANVGKNMSCDENESWNFERKSSEMGGDSTALFNTPGASTVCEATQGPPQSNRLWTKRMNSSHRLDNMVRNRSLSFEGDKLYTEESCVHSAVTGNVSTVKQWKPTSVVPDFHKSDSSSKLARGVMKDNTLMAKLLEARLEDHKSRSRASKSSL